MPTVHPQLRDNTGVPSHRAGQTIVQRSPTTPRPQIVLPSIAQTPSSRMYNRTDHPDLSATRQPREQSYPLGTREDVQQDDYESPVASMFGRAYGRYREAEAARQAAHVQHSGNHFEHPPDIRPIEAPATAYGSGPNPLADPTAMTMYPQLEGDRVSVADRMTAQIAQMARMQQLSHEAFLRRSDRQSYLFTRNDTTSTVTGTEYGRDQRTAQTLGFTPGSPPVLPLMRPNPYRARTGFHRQFYTNPFETSVRQPQDDLIDTTESSLNPIDAQVARPRPMQSEELKVDFGCKICTEQKINTVCMPCMHACMCRWCAAIHKDDCRDYDTRRWNSALWKCPICRKRIHEVKRFYV